MSSVEIKLKTYIDFSGTETPKMPFLTKKKWAIVSVKMREGH